MTMALLASLLIALFVIVKVVREECQGDSKTRLLLLTNNVAA